MTTTTAHRSPAYLAAVRDALVTDAEAAVAQYPQYAGHFDGYLVAKVIRRINHRGAHLEVGTLVLINPASVHTVAAGDTDYLPRAHGKTFATIWFPAVKVGTFTTTATDTSVRADYLEVIG